MTLRRRLQELERMLPGTDALADDSEHALWRLFCKIALEVLAPSPETRTQVEQSMSIQESCIFRPDWQPTALGVDMRFCFCEESLWAALEKFPEARQELDQALIEAFGDKGADGQESLAEKHLSQGDGDGHRAPGDGSTGLRET